jgi:hypothetical protein
VTASTPGADARLSTRAWVVTAVVAVVLTGWPGALAVVIALVVLGQRSRPGDLVLSGALGVGLALLAVLIHGLPSSATLSPDVVADNWPAHALAAVSLTLVTVGAFVDARVTDEPPLAPMPGPGHVGRARSRVGGRTVALGMAAGVALCGGFALVYVAGEGRAAPAPDRHLADRMLDGDGMQVRDEAGVKRPTAARMPVVPAVLAVSHAGNGPSQAQRVTWALAGVATALLCAATARRLFGNRAAVVAGGLVLLLPVFVLDHARRDNTALAGLAVAALVAILVRASSSGAPGWAIAAGGAAGVLALTRPEGLIIGAAVVGAWLLGEARAGRRRAGSYVVVAVAAALLIVGPWLVRNHDQVGTWWPSSRVGEIVAGANTASTYRTGDLLGSHDPGAAAVAASDVATGSSEGRVASDQLGDGIRYATRHPVDAVRAAGARLLRAFELWDGRAERRVQELRGVDGRAWGWRQASFLVLLGLGVTAAVRRRRSGLERLLPVLAGVAAAALVAILTYGDPIVRATIDPLIAIAAGGLFTSRRATGGAPIP